MEYLILGRTRKNDIKEIETNHGLQNKERYSYVRNLVWKILLDNNITELPVDLIKITSNNKIQVNTYSEINSPAMRELTQDCLGVTIKDTRTNKVYILFDDSLREDITRFTLAHEIGHYFLDHVTDSPQKETEANMFAARLLMPVIILYEIDVKSAEQIKRLCNVSQTAADFRYTRLLELKQRGQFYNAKLEQDLAKQFNKFIKQKKEEK